MELLDVLERVVSNLTKLNVPYMVGGSIASSQQEAELELLLAKLESAEAKEQETVKRVEVSRQKAQESIRESSETLRQLAK